MEMGETKTQILFHHKVGGKFHASPEDSNA